VRRSRPHVQWWATQRHASVVVIAAVRNPTQAFGALLGHVGATLVLEAGGGRIGVAGCAARRPGPPLEVFGGAAELVTDGALIHRTGCA